MTMIILPFILVILSLPKINSTIVGRCTRKREGSRCQAPNADWQYDGVCVKDSVIRKLACHVPHPRHFSFKLVAWIEVLPSIKGAKSIEKLWIRGAGPGLSWERAKEMRKPRENYWTLDINYTSGSSALLCVKESKCTLNQRALEFRVYRDEHGMDGMLGPNIFIHLPISNSMISSSSGFSAPYSYFYPWFDNKIVSIQQFSYTARIHYHPLSKRFKVSMILPPSYSYNMNKRYSIIILFGPATIAKQIVPILESMYIHESNIEEVVILVYHSRFSVPWCSFNPFRVSNPPMENSLGLNHIFRCVKNITITACRKCMTCLDRSRAEFCTAAEFSAQAKKCNEHYAAGSCRGIAGDILDNLENTVLPDISLRTFGRIRVDFPKDRISVIGMDGGGLLACFAALFRPSIYKNAACISASFHWPHRNLDIMESRVDEGIGFLINEVTEKMKIRKELQILYNTQKYYIDVGEDDNRFMPIINSHNYSDWVVEQLKTRLKVDARNIVYFRNILGAENDIVHLRQEGDFRIIDRIKIPLLFFLKPEGGFSAKYPRLPKLSRRDYISRRMSLGVSLTKANGSISTKELEKMEKSSYKSCKDIIKTPSSLLISVPLYIISVGSSVLVATILSVVLMEIRYHNKRAAAEDDISSDDSDEEMEFKKNK